MGFPEKPKELDLYPLEERLISLRIPFMQIHQLPRGGQFSIKGNVVNVPVDIQLTINSLPRTLDKCGTISVKLKKKLSYKSCDFRENIRPCAVICALHYLMNKSELYKSSGIEIDENWVNEIKDTMATMLSAGNEENDASNEDDNSDHFNEIVDSDLQVGNTDTLLDEIEDEGNPKYDTEYVFAPGEGQKPLALYTDPDAEYLSFPSIFCGEKRPANKERSVPVQYSDIVKWELRSVDRRVAQSVPNIFFKLKKIQLKNITDRANLALRRCKSEGKKWTAKDVLNPTTVNDLVKLDEGYFIFRTLRNSPAYLEKKKKDVFAMIRQLGLPTWFGSFSSADTRWHDLLKVLGKLNDGKDYTDQEIEEMDWNQKTRLVQKDPVTCSRFFDNRVQQFIKIVLKSEHIPIGKIRDYFYRVEFQQRGSPHIHILIWIENAPCYKIASDEEVVKYIDKHVSCSLDSKPKDLLNLQIHKHSKTCRKKGHPICRFGFPLPPLPKTMILEPLETEIDKYKSMYTDVQTKINALHDREDIESLTFEEFLADIIEMTEENYIKVIRSTLNSAKVFLQRKPCEVRVNPYMKIVLSAWKANHDLQFILDPYACAMYIVSYISKSQKGMSALLDQAAKEARQGNLDLKRQVRHIGNYFTNSVETSAQEAIYLTLQMPLTKATRQVVFVNTSPQDKRTFLLKQTAVLEKMSPNSTDIECDNDIKRYSKRPKSLENWCLADYISQLEVKYPKKNDTQERNDDDISDSDEAEHSQNEDDESNQEMIKRINITMRNGVTIKQRKSYRVLRYVRFNKKTDSENFYRERLLLFFPWRKEEDLKGNHETYEQMYNSVKSFLNHKVKQYEQNAEELDKAREDAENECNNFDEIAPATEHTEQEDLEAGTMESEQYVHFNPDRPPEQKKYDMADDLGITSKTVEMSSHVTRLPENEYLELIRCLNKKQQEFFQHVVTWVTNKDDPIYAFLTGGAGVGKSVVVRACFQALHRHLYSQAGENPDDIRILLCAPTGKAAYNIGGVTLHNAFQIQPNKGLNQTLSCDIRNTLQMKYRNLSIIMIDEISMVGNKMLSLLNTRLQAIKGNHKLFGGVSIIAIGDFYQLKPVFDGWIFEDLNKGISALAPNLWKDLFQMHELTEIMRQKDDIEFANLLNRLRVNALTENDAKILKKRMISQNDQDYPHNSVHLFTENDLVDSFNIQCIARLKTEKIKVQAFDTVQADVSSSIKTKLLSSLPRKQTDTANLAKEVELAICMKYDLTANIDVADGLTNGSSCEIKKIENRQPEKTSRPSVVWVQFEDKKIGSNTRTKYSNLYAQNIEKSWTPIFDIKRSFTYNRRNYERIQFPLRPSAGKTIHKSQGDTLDEVVVNMNSKCKAKIPHIHYVALSRVRSLKGLYIMNFNKEKIAVSESVNEELQRLRKDAVIKLCFTPLYVLGDNLLKFAFNNARSLHAHFKDIKSDPNVTNADIIGISETRLIQSDSDDEYALHGFMPLIRNDQRPNDIRARPPHGLAVYIKNGILVDNVSVFSSSNVEYVSADIMSDKGHIQIVYVYKAPACRFADFKETLLLNLLPQLNVRDNILIMGDFNFDLTVENTNFLRFMENTFKCKQFIAQKTTQYGSILDLAFLNVNPNALITTGVLEAYWSDHKVIYAAVDLH